LVEVASHIDRCLKNKEKHLFFNEKVVSL